MFRRVVLEEWHTTLAGIGLALVGLMILTVFIRALTMKSDRVERMARLPLEEKPSDSTLSRHE